MRGRAASTRRLQFIWRLTGQRVAAHYACTVITFAAPACRGEFSFRAVVSRAVVAAGLCLTATYTTIPLPAAATSEAQALRPWSEATPPLPALPRFGETQGARFAVAGETAAVTLLHFFASWCEPCRDELPALKRLADRGAPDLKVVAVAVADNDMRLRRLLDDTGVTFPVLMDQDRGAAKAWSIAALPSTVVLDSQHRPRLIVESDFAWDTIEPKALIERLSSPAAHSSLARNAQQATTSTLGGQ